MRCAVFVSFAALALSACDFNAAYERCRAAGFCADDAGHDAGRPGVWIDPLAGVSTKLTQIHISGLTDGGGDVLVGGQPCPLFDAGPGELHCTAGSWSGIARVDVQVGQRVVGSFFYVGEPIAWFDAAAAGVLTIDSALSDGGFLDGGITTWADRSTAHNDVTPHEADLRPTFVPQWANGWPAVHFQNPGNGMDYHTDVSLSTPYGASLPMGTESRSLFVVASTDQFDNHGKFMFAYGDPDTHTDGGRFGFARSGGSLNVEVGQRALSTADISGTLLQPGAPFLMSYVYQANTTLGANSLGFDGVSVSATDDDHDGFYTLGTWLTIGGVGNSGFESDSHSGSIGEVILYRTALDGGERATVEQYLLQKYAIH